MYHSLYFVKLDKDEGINTFEDWHIVPDSRPLFMPPSVRTEYVIIPGSMGALDYTGVLTGSVQFDDRTGSWTFYVLNGYQEWYQLYSQILNYIQGKKFRIWLEDDPNHYYIARLTVDKWDSKKDWSKIKISYVADPQRYEGVNPCITP